MTDSQLVPIPKIICHPSATTAHVKDKVELECIAEGASVYEWYKDGKLLKSNGESGKLTLQDVTPSDSGMYHCVVISSKGGKVTSQKAKLMIGNTNQLYYY